MIEAAASCALLLMLIFGGVGVIRWRDRRNEPVRLIRDEGPDAIGRMTVRRRDVWLYTGHGFYGFDCWEYEADRPDLVAKVRQWQAANN